MIRSPRVGMKIRHWNDETLKGEITAVSDEGRIAITVEWSDGRISTDVAPFQLWEDLPLEPEQMAEKAQADDILAKLDAFMLRTLSLHDVGKALPHPYNAIGDMANGIAHDFASIAFGIRTYVERTRPE